MKLYFSPLACSLATRISLYEAGADVTFERVDGKTKRTERGRNYLDVSPLGLVPSLELDDGRLLTESSALLQYVARRFPHAKLTPTDERGTAELQQWLSFIGSELHKSLTPLMVDDAGPDAKRYALGLTGPRLAWVARHLAEREYLLGEFSVADPYLFAVLNWTQVTPVDLKAWPSLLAFQARMASRPSVARALAEEVELYRQEQAQRR